eukprot:351083-Chlamydomonas_euryale.AAC.11
MRIGIAATRGRACPPTEGATPPSSSDGRSSYSPESPRVALRSPAPNDSAPAPPSSYSRLLRAWMWPPSPPPPLLLLAMAAKEGSGPGA